MANLVWLLAVCSTLFAFPLLLNLGRCYRAILNDARIIALDPALQGNFEILYAYPGFWALFWYRLSHALLHRRIPVVSSVLPRLAMSLVRYATAIDIHPSADISGEGILIDHGAGLVIGATAVVGGAVTLYHGVTLGNSGKKVPAGAKRHPTIGNRVVIGAGAKILGDIEIGDDVLVGANTVVTKPVPRNHTAVGVPARVLCHGAATGKDVAGAAICELHRRLQKVESDAEKVGNWASVAVPSTAVPAAATVMTTTSQDPEDRQKQQQRQQQQQQQQQQTAGERRESSTLDRRSIAEEEEEPASAVGLLLPRPSLPRGDRPTDALPPRFVPGASPSQRESSPPVASSRGVAPRKETVGAAEGVGGGELDGTGLGYILYSLRVLAD